MNRDIRQTRTMAGEFRAKRAENDNPIIEGRFISFTGEYRIGNWGVETVSPDLQIEGDDIRALIDHETRLVLGRTTAGTLSLETRDDGVYGTININPNDADAMNLYARVERGDVNQCSFGFNILDEETEFLEDDTMKWTIKSIRLFEVSVVTFPAYEDTGVSARADDVAEMKRRKLEAWKAHQLQRLHGGN